MELEQALLSWKAACEEASLSWYLWGEALLCANALRELPGELNQIRVAAAPGDLRRAEELAKLHPLIRPEASELAVGEPVMLPCSKGSYPAPAEYRNYLQQTFGDYEAGFFDGIGVGLTWEGKLELKAHQEKCREALAFVEKISEEFGLTYYLLAGSVLGAVRHGGFIPWDDDIDIGIPAQHRARFEAVVGEQLPKYLGPEFTLEQPGADHPYPRMFSKICFRGRCCIDFWPLVPTCRSGWKGKLTWILGKVFMKLHYCKIGCPVERFRRIGSILGAVLSDQQVMALAKWNEETYSQKNFDAYVNLYSIYSREKETIPRAWLETPARADFCGISVPVVGHTEEYLRHLYGDYLRLPPPWKRASRHVERFVPPDYF